MKYAAIDFETATGDRNSACAVGIVTLDSGAISDTFYTLIQPPDNYYWSDFTEIHGITDKDTAGTPTFAALFPQILARLQGRTLIAHNATFDSGVLLGTMTHYGIRTDELAASEWVCTMRLYQRLGFKPSGLDACCKRLGIALDHHNALSDALGCAELFLRKGEHACP
jgi:DNA polymerase-3 subunit epsilon